MQTENQTTINPNYTFQFGSTTLSLIWLFNLTKGRFLIQVQFLKILSACDCHPNFHLKSSEDPFPHWEFKGDF